VTDEAQAYFIVHALFGDEEWTTPRKQEG
jgi:hypothetical protein